MSPGRVAIVTLGCMKNRVDSSVMQEHLERAGWSVIQFDDDDPSARVEMPLDAVVINTCCFILPAREEAINTILDWAELRARGEVGRLIVAGCLAQRHGDELLEEIPDVDAVVGTGSLDRVAPVLDDTSRAIDVGPAGYDYGAGGRPASYARPPVGVVALAGGCSRRCGFCVIPAVRGPYRSRKPAAIRRDVEELLDQGCLEINLVAQDSTFYGRDLDPPSSLTSVLSDLGSLGGDFWIRVLYTYPTAVDDGLLDLLGSGEPYAPYLDVPLQHMSDRILKRMGRPERRVSILRLLDRAKDRSLFIRTSFIVGFPGETEDDFGLVESALRDGMFNHAGIFVFSPEDGTPAADLDGRVGSRLAGRRRDRALAAWEEGAGRLHQSLLGRRLPVLADGPAPGWGRHWGQAPDVDGYTFVDGLPPGLSSAVITSATATDFWGRTPAG